MQRTVRPYAIAAVSVVTVTVVRWLLDPALEDRHIFSVYYAAVAISAWYGGLRPALVALCAGWLAADWFFLEPRRSLSLADPDSLLGSMTYCVIGLAILACTEGIRRASQRTVQIAAEPSELRAVADAVRVHRINSRELVAYLEGLNAGPETFIAAAQYEDFDLEPDELATRLEALAHEGPRSPATSV
jgi:K+-sensing histidine kinase KdpD